MDYDIGWDLCRSYLSVLKEGSLSGAARALGIAQPTVGRHIAALEKSLGLTLFTRSQHGLLPTEAALELQIFAQHVRSPVRFDKHWRSVPVDQEIEPGPDVPQGPVRRETGPSSSAIGGAVLHAKTGR